MFDASGRNRFARATRPPCRRVGGRFTAPWPLLLAALAVASAAPAVAAGHATAAHASAGKGRAVVAPSLPGPKTPFFWDRFVAARRLLASNPDSAAALAAARLRGDPEDFLGSWLTGELLMRHAADSTRVRALLMKAQVPPGSPGLWVTAGTIYFVVNKVQDGRTAFDHARERYEAAHRDVDAAHAALFRVVLRSDRSDQSSFSSDLAGAETLARLTKDPMAIADAVNYVASVYAGQEVNHDVAMRLEVIGLIDSLGPSYQLMETHRTLGLVLRSAGIPDSAEMHTAAALAIADSLRLGPEQCWCLSALSKLRADQGDYHGSLARARETLARAEKYEYGGDLANACVNLATAFQRLGDFDDGIRMRAKAVEALRRPPPPGGVPSKDEDLALALDQLGTVEAFIGRLDAGRGHLEEAAALARQPALHARLPYVLLHLAQVYADLNEEKEAEACVHEGLEAADETRSARGRALLLYMRASLERRSGRDDAALNSLLQAIGTAESGAADIRSLISRGAGELRLSLGEPAAAAAAMDSSLAGTGSRTDSLEVSRELALKAEALAAGGDGMAAFAVASHALKLARAYPQPPLLAGALGALGEAELALGRTTDALNDLGASVAITDSTTGRLTFRDDRSDFRPPVDEARVALARAWIAAGHPDSAFDVAERARARDVRQAFGVAAPEFDANVPKALGDSLREAESSLAGAESAVNEECTRTEHSRSPEFGWLVAHRDSLAMAWSLLRRRVILAAPAYARAVGLTPPMTAAGAVRALAPGERLIAFMPGYTGTLRFELDAAGVHAAEIPWGDRELASTVAAYRTTILSTDTGGMAMAASVADTLLGGDADPLAGRGDVAGPTATIDIIPDGALAELPFESLRVKDAGGNRVPLVKRAVIRYAFSADDLLSEPAVTASPPAIAAPLPDDATRASRDQVFVETISLRMKGAGQVVVPLWSDGGWAREPFESELNRRIAAGETAREAMRAMKLAAIDAGAPPGAWAVPILIGPGR